MKRAISTLVRDNILNLQPYEAARHLESNATVFLDANENPFDSEFNRYPDPWQKLLKQKLSEIKEVPTDNLFIGNGSDEIIDLLMRIFCEPAKEAILITPPTYGMYEVSAAINNVPVIKVSLNNDYSLDIDSVLKSINENIKIIFLCSPNNPTGNVIDSQSIEKLLNKFNGIVVIDEAYIDFSSTPSWLERLPEFDNLFIMQTLSKAYGLAGLRLGLGFGGKEIIGLLNKVKPPYNISSANQKAALSILNNHASLIGHVEEIIDERERLIEILEIFPFIKKIHPSEANFILVAADNADAIFDFLKNEGLLVRNRSNVLKCAGCLRITIGTPEENNLLIRKLKQYE